MKRSSIAHMNCSIARSLELLGEWWTLMIVRDVFLGLVRFDRIREDLGISRNILSDRLATLVAHGILDRAPYRARPVRYEYRLTDKGRDLLSVLLAFMRWGDRWLAGEGGPPMRVMHRGCRHEAGPVLACAHCGATIGTTDVALTKGPGWRDPVPAPRRARRASRARRPARGRA
jgi:DNA-binding HxlR family transcriptional regulator